MNVQTKSTRLRIKGVLSISQWDESEESGTLALMTDNDEEYLIEVNSNQARFLDLVDSYVEVTGTVHLRDGDKHIAPTNIVECDERYDDIENGFEEIDYRKFKRYSDDFS